MTTIAHPQTSAGAGYAGFWIRFGAFIIDSIALSLITGVFTGGQAITNPDLANAQHSGTSTLASFLYFTLLWSSIGGGQTLGMRLLGLRVVGREERPIDYGTAVLRYIGFVLSVIPLLLGLVWAAFDGRKQGWHDKLAGTFVTRS
jgi:uncharacterized RDD family membrane protein YckC